MSFAMFNDQSLDVISFSPRVMYHVLKKTTEFLVFFIQIYQQEQLVQ